MVSYLFKRVYALKVLHNYEKTIHPWWRVVEPKPAEIALLKSLEVLNLSNNKLTSLPVEIGKLSMLRTLNLAGNLIAKIPEEIKNCSSLKSVNLKGSVLSAADQAKLATLLPNAKIKY